MLENLWDGGSAGTSGGVVAGGLALVLELVVSKVGAVILCIAGFLLALITSLNDVEVCNSLEFIQEIRKTFETV